MAAVFAQMGGDPIGTGRHCRKRRPHRVRMSTAPRITDSGNMIYVNAQPEKLTGHARNAPN